MRKSISSAIAIAFAALLCLTCGDSGTNSRSSSPDGSVDAFAGKFHRKQPGQEIPPAVVPNTPANVSGSAVSQNSITISWPPVSGAAGYRIYRGTSPFGSYTHIGTTSATSYTDDGLSANTTYYYKVLAYNGAGESPQSSYASAKTSPDVTPPTDGTFKTVLINGMTWMKENLNIETPGSWCYRDSASYCAKYGRLYTWDAAMSVCPSGWRLPTREEWGALAVYAGGVGAYGSKGEAGIMLKSTSGWNNDGNGADSYGFSALPGGLRYPGGNFYSAGGYGYWWTATENENGYAYCRYMGNSGDNMDEYPDDKKGGFSVRCLRDD
jgi:uncharacterized protein (TIGR02145 family)